jgi:hypothetical protein
MDERVFGASRLNCARTEGGLLTFVAFRSVGGVVIDQTPERL